MRSIAEGQAMAWHAARGIPVEIERVSSLEAEDADVVAVAAHTSWLRTTPRRRGQGIRCPVHVQHPAGYAPAMDLGRCSPRSNHRVPNGRRLPGLPSGEGKDCRLPDGPRPNKGPPGLSASILDGRKALHYPRSGGYSRRDHLAEVEEVIEILG